ncbi:MAG TPA: GNAT family N-acetyltransferase [Micropepsaceae bacterium]|nr:GNAT family N-acetyltransferase [Micropepsaceae bacterium]
MMARLERAASVRFRDIGMPELAEGDHAPPDAEVETMIASGHVLIAEMADAPVGFAAMGVADDVAHLIEIDVVPEAGGKGIGRALVEEVCRLAHSRGFSRITLSTFRDVAWNAPFYARCGFGEWPRENWGPEHQRMWKRQEKSGLDMSRRLFMVRELTG